MHVARDGGRGAARRARRPSQTARRAGTGLPSSPGGALVAADCVMQHGGGTRQGGGDVRSGGVAGRGGSATRQEARKRGCLWDQAGSSSQHDRVRCPHVLPATALAVLRLDPSASVLQAVMRHRLGGGRVIGVPAAKPAGAVPNAATATAPKSDGSGAAKAAGTESAAMAATTAKADGSGVATSVHTPVHHVRQNFKWDCGIACILMLLHTRGEPKRREDLIAMVGTNSVWTVDLAYIMHKCGLSCVFHTVMEGVREEYATEVFYKDELDEDRARVEKLFRGAKAAGVAVSTKAVTIAHIAEAVLQEKLAIVLTDRRILRPKSDEKQAAGLRTRSDRVSYKTRATASNKARAADGASGGGTGRAPWVSSERDAAIVSAELSGSFTGHYVVRPFVRIH